MSKASARLGLHAKGRLQRLDAGFELAVGAALGQVLAVELLQQVELPPLRVRGRATAFCRYGIIFCGSRFGVVDVRALILGRQEAAGPQLREPHRPAGAEHDVARQVLVLGAQAVQEPRAHAGPRRRDRAVVHHEQGRPVVRVVGVQRADDAQVVGMLGQVRQQLADRQAACAVLANSNGEAAARRWRVRCAARLPAAAGPAYLLSTAWDRRNRPETARRS